MLKKLTPIKLSEEAQKQIVTQTVERVAPKSTDPKNYPVFEVPTGKKILVYVPNHNVESPDGNIELRMDKPLIHSLQDGRRFLSIRCINGLEDEANGYDGSCPLCDGVPEPWDLARKRIESKCSAQALDPEDTDNKDVKSIRSAEFSDRVLKEANRYYTFPIAVIETTTDEKGKMSISRDENGIKYQLYWYSISEAQYIAKWIPALEAMEGEPNSPGGYFFYLNFSYDSKGKEMNKRDAARNMTVNHRNMSKASWYDTFRKQVDEQTEGWTPEKAQETVIANAFYSFADLQRTADDVLADTRAKLALYESSDLAGELNAPRSNTPALPGMKKVEPQSEEQALADVGETDEDFDV